MAETRKYMAGSVPRFLRQTRLGYLPLHCVIGSRLIEGPTGSNLYFDIVMLPIREFTRMKSNIGLQHIIAPALQMGSTFTPGFMVVDAQTVTVPDNEPDPENFARAYFAAKFNLPTFEKPIAKKILRHMNSAFSRAAYECTAR